MYEPWLGMSKTNVSKSLFGKLLRLSIAPRLWKPFVNRPVNALLIRGVTIVANGSNGPRIGEMAVPNAFSSPEIINDIDDPFEEAGAVTADGDAAGGVVAATVFRNAVESNG